MKLSSILKFFLAPDVTKDKETAADRRESSVLAPDPLQAEAAQSTVIPPARPSILQRNLNLTVLHGLFNGAAISMVGPFTAIFAMRLGASKLHVAFLTSAPAIVSLLVMIPSALLLDRTDRKKRFTYLFMFAHRAFYLGLVCVPFFAEPARATVFVLLLALMNLPGAVSNVAWQTFVSKIVPSERRAGVFAARNRLISIFGTLVTLVVGLFLDRALFPIGYQIIFTLAFLVAVVEMYVFNLTVEPVAPEPPVTDHVPVPKANTSPPMGSPYPSFNIPFRIPVIAHLDHYRRKAGKVVGEILQERRFVKYTLASMLFYLALQIPWPLFSWYQVRVLNANNVWVSLLALMNTGGALAGYGIWRRLIERWGNMKTLVIATTPIFFTCVAYAFSTNLYTIAAANLIVGAIFAGVNITLFNAMLEVSPEQRKATFIAVFNTAVTLSAIVAPLIGVSLLTFMSFRAAFLVTAALRVVGSLVYLGLYRREQWDGPADLQLVGPGAA